VPGESAVLEDHELRDHHYSTHVHLRNVRLGHVHPRLFLHLSRLLQAQIGPA